jgi:hypothetical protein
MPVLHAYHHVTGNGQETVFVTVMLVMSCFGRKQEGTTEEDIESGEIETANTNFGMRKSRTKKVIEKSNKINLRFFVV